jgi:DNA-binding SARP family transcriptional activator
VDAVRFQELLAETRGALRDGEVRAASDAVAAALALWRGPALRGLTGTAWFSAEARRLETLHVDALEEQFEVALALGEHRELTPALRSALAVNPFRERLWGQLMLALYRSGRQADALETFQEARRVLGELGLEPGAGAEAPPGGDPRARSGDRGRPCRPQAPRQSPGACDVVRRP